MAKAKGQQGGEAIRDLGYRPYVGERLPAKHNSSVLLRHGLRRAWGSWLVKIAAFLCWLPPVIAMGGVGINYWMRSQRPGMVEPVEAGWVLSVVYEWQMWLFVTMVTLGAGASVIAEDFQHKSFQFYFAKPVTRVQYLSGRISAVAIWVFCLLAVPGALLVLILVGSAEPDDRVANLGTILPAMIQAGIVAVVASTASVGVSSLSKSRALTMTAWMLLFIVPHVLAVIVEAVADWEWLRLISIPALLNEMNDTLFKQPDENDIGWAQALPILVGVSVGGLALAMGRLRRAEAIS